MLALSGLLEWVADVVVHAIAVGADQVPGCFIKPDASPLDLDDKNAEVWMSDDEVRLAVAGPAQVVFADPLDVAGGDPVVVQLADAGIAQSPLGGGFGARVKDGGKHLGHWELARGYALLFHCSTRDQPVTQGTFLIWRWHIQSFRAADAHSLAVHFRL
jgi:hypothetical protein